jgi:hypothetical protein
MYFEEEDILNTLSEFKARDTVGWGPDPNYVFHELENTPFQPFSRIDKGIKCCEFTN